MFQGRVRVGRTGTGMIHVGGEVVRLAEYSRHARARARECSYRSVFTRFRNGHSPLLAGHFFRRDVVLFHDGSALLRLLRLKNRPPFRRTGGIFHLRSLRTGHRVLNICFYDYFYNLDVQFIYTI